MNLPADSTILDVTLDSTRDSVTRIGKMFAEAFERLRLPEDTIFDLRLAAQEAVVNAVEHGNHCDETKKVYVHCWLNGDSLRVTVRDEGSGFDPRKVPDPTLPENILKEHGRGIFLMRNLCDEVRFSPQGNEVTLVKKLTCPPPCPATDS